MSNARLFVGSFARPFVCRDKFSVVVSPLPFCGLFYFFIFWFRWLRLTTGHQMFKWILSAGISRVSYVHQMPNHVCVLIGLNCRLSRSFRHSQAHQCSSRCPFFCCVTVSALAISKRWNLVGSCQMHFGRKGLKMSIRYILMHILLSSFALRWPVCCSV